MAAICIVNSPVKGEDVRKFEGKMKKKYGGCWFLDMSSQEKEILAFLNSKENRTPADGVTCDKED